MKHLLANDKVRFIIAGLANTGLDFLLLNCFVFLLGAEPLIGNVFSVTIGITISYLMNHYFVFQSPERPSLKKYLTFFAITGFSSLILQSVIIFGFASFFEADFSRSLFLIEQISQNQFMELNIAKVAAVAIGMVWNFMLYKYIIFKPNKKKTDIEQFEELTD